MRKSKRTMACALAAMALMLPQFASAEDAKRELLMTPGKGVSFYMGAKHGVTYFLSDNGMCQLTLAIGDSPEMDGMNPGSSTRVTMSVVPGRPAKVETTDGETLMIGCAPGGQMMQLIMPQNFRLKDGQSGGMQGMGGMAGKGAM